MFRNNYTKMFIRVHTRGVMKFADVQFLSHARNIGLREKMRRIFSVYNNEANGAVYMRLGYMVRNN